MTLVSWLEARRHLCFEVLRIYLGAGLFVKGVLFASDPKALSGWASQGSLEASIAILAHYIVLAHLVGGLMLAVGLLTRVAAAVNVPILIGAVVFVHASDGLFTRAQGLEFTLLVLLALVLMVWHGSGQWSLDRVLFAPKRHAEPAPELLA